MSNKAPRQMIRTSERKTFKRCPQRWFWAWEMGLDSKEPSKALWFGIGWHEVMAHYYRPGTKRSKDYIDKWREYCDTPDADGMFGTADELGQEWVDLRELGEIMLHAYVKEYQGDKHWDVIQPEYSGEVLIPSNDGSHKIEYCFTFDGVYRDKNTKKIMLMEHKTARAISIGHLSLDDQGGSYWAVAPTILRDRGILGAKESIRGITYNFVRKGKPPAKEVGPDGYVRNNPGKVQYHDAFDKQGIKYLPSMGLVKLAAIAEEANLKVLGDISKVQPAPLFKRENVIRTVKERRTQIQRIKDEADWMAAARSGELPLIKTPTEDCSRFCPFFNMCEVHDAQGDWEEFARTVYKKRNMFEMHIRKSAGDA